MKPQLECLEDRCLANGAWASLSTTQQEAAVGLAVLLSYAGMPPAQEALFFSFALAVEQSGPAPATGSGGNPFAVSP